MIFIVKHKTRKTGHKLSSLPVSKAKISASRLPACKHISDIPTRFTGLPTALPAFPRNPAYSALQNKPELACAVGITTISFRQTCAGRFTQ